MRFTFSARWSSLVHWELRLARPDYDAFQDHAVNQVSYPDLVTVGDELNDRINELDAEESR